MMRGLLKKGFILVKAPAVFNLMRLICGIPVRFFQRWVGLVIYSEFGGSLRSLLKKRMAFDLFPLILSLIQYWSDRRYFWMRLGPNVMELPEDMRAMSYA